MEIHVREAVNGKWYLRLVGDNGKIVAHTQTYTRKWNAQRQAKKLEAMFAGDDPAPEGREPDMPTSKTTITELRAKIVVLEKTIADLRVKIALQDRTIADLRAKIDTPPPVPPAPAPVPPAPTPPAPTPPDASVALDMRVGMSAIQTDTNALLSQVQAGMSRSLAFCNVHQHGWGLNGARTNPSPGVYSWAAMDARMKWASPAGVEPVVTFCGAPLWMRQGNWTGLPISSGDLTSTGAYDYSFPHPDHWDHFAAFAAAQAQRYPNVKIFQFWNEMKGLWWSAQNRWWYEGYLDLYRLTTAAIFKVRPDAIVVGPYPVFNIRGGASSWNTADSLVGHGVDKRDADVLRRWLIAQPDHRHHLSVDLKNSTRDGIYTDTDRFSVIRKSLDYLNAHIPIWEPDKTGTPRRIIVSEWYARTASDSTASENERLAMMTWSLVHTALASTTRGIDVLLWQMLEPDPGHAHPLGMFRPDGTSTKLVDVLAWFKANIPGRVTRTGSGDKLGLAATDGSSLTVDRAASTVTITPPR